MSTSARKFLEKLNNGPLTFGQMLRAIRETEEITQVEMADLLGISKANLCDIEKGRKLVSVEKAAFFAKQLEQSEVVFVEIAFEDQARKAGLNCKVSVSFETA